MTPEQCLTPSTPPSKKTNGYQSGTVLFRSTNPEIFEGANDYSQNDLLNYVHFGLCRTAAHSDCCFFCAVYKYSYLLTYLYAVQEHERPLPCLHRHAIIVNSSFDINTCFYSISGPTLRRICSCPELYYIMYTIREASTILHC